MAQAKKATPTSVEEEMQQLLQIFMVDLKKYGNTLKTCWKSECLNWQLREGLIWCWWQLTKAFVIPMAHFWNQLLPLQTRCDSPIFRYFDIPIFEHSKILVFQYFDVVMFCTQCFLGCCGDAVPVVQGDLKRLLECCWRKGAPVQSPVASTPLNRI